MALYCVKSGCDVAGCPSPAYVTLRGCRCHQLWVFQDNLANSVEDAGDNLSFKLWVVAVLCQVDEASHLWAVLCNVFQDGRVHRCAFCVHAGGCEGGCYCGGGVLHGVGLSSVVLSFYLLLYMTCWWCANLLRYFFIIVLPGSEK